MPDPVVLIHGIGDTRSSFRRLRDGLHASGWTVHDFDLTPNNGAARLEELAEQTSLYIDQALSPGQRFHLVGFSMGGLVARYYAQRLATPGRVARLITVSTPHKGTWTALLRNRPGVLQMRPGSRFLSDLSGDTQSLRQVPFTSICSPLDLMIVPASSSVVPEANCRQVIVPAHALMMRSRRVLRLIEKALSS